MFVKTRRRGASAVAALGALIVLASGAVASAAEPTEARVTGVEGRTVTVVVPIPADSAVSTASSLDSTLEVRGRVLPARTALPVADSRPRAVALVLDTSGSMDGRSMVAARRAAGAYLDALPSGVDAGLVTFADRPEVAARMGSAHTEIESALARTRARGGTSLYDAVRVAMDQIPADAEGRLLVLTDGDDTSSGSTLMGTARAARQNGVVVDVVLLGDGARPVAEELAVSGTVATAGDAESLVRSFRRAALAVAPKVTVTAEVPEEIDAAGALATVAVSGVDGSVSAEILLPDVASLQGPAGADASASAPAADSGQAGTPASVPGPARGASEGPSALVMAALGALAAVGVILCVAWGAHAVVVARRRRERIADVLAYSTGGPRRRPGDGPGTGRTAPVDGWDRRITATRWGRDLQARLAAADVSLGPATWLLATALTAGSTGLLLWILIDRLWLAMLVALLVVPMLFGVLLRSRIDRRRRAFADELPEFLLLLSSALRAGLSFTQGLESAAGQQQGQVGRQMRRALAEAQLSANLDEALLSSAARMDNEDLRWVVTALSVQREVGGNLSVILDNAAATIKGRHALSREVRALSAEGRLSAYVLLALPLGVFGFLLVFRREYVSQLWTHALGIAMLAALVVLMVVGWVWMRAVVRIRV